MKAHPNTWWDFAKGDTAWRQEWGDILKLYPLRRIYVRTVHHRFWLASPERLKYAVYECKHLYIPLTWNVWKQEHYVVDVFLACLEFFVPLENFSLIWGRHHFRWRVANFDLCSALMAIEKWWFFRVPHCTFCDTGHPFIVVISEDPWHSHLMLNFLQWSCHYLF